MNQQTTQQDSPATPLQRAIAGAPVGESFTADFKKDTWTFKVPPYQPVRAGRYVLPPEVIANLAVEQERLQAENIITLAAPEQVRADYFNVSGMSALKVSDGEGYDLHLYRRQAPDPERKCDFNPAHWYGSESRRDAQGTSWSRHGLRFVQDDFGTLVEVPA